MVDIKSTSNITRFSTPINEGSKRKYTLMKEDYITLKFSVDNPVYFKLGDYVDEPFGLFELVDLCKPTINEATGGYDYELRLDAYYWKWKNKKMFYSPEVGGSEAGWSLTATLDVHMKVFLRNLATLGYTHKDGAFSVKIDSTVQLSSKLVSYDNTNLIDALTRIAETWECEWWIIGSVIHFGRCEFGEPVDFDLSSNVSSMSRSDSKTSYATRVYAFGSTRNIPSTYRKSLIFDVKEEISGRWITDTARKLESKFFPESSLIEERYSVSLGFNVLFTRTLSYTCKIADELIIGKYKLECNGVKFSISTVNGINQPVIYFPKGAYFFGVEFHYKLNGSQRKRTIGSESVIVGENEKSNISLTVQLEDYINIEGNTTDCEFEVYVLTPSDAIVQAIAYNEGEAVVRMEGISASTSVTFQTGTNAGKSFDAIFNPYFETGDEANVLMLQEGVTASAGDTYTIDNIIRSKVPSNYFSKSTTEITVEGVVTNRLMLPVGTNCVNAYEDMTQEEAIEDIVIFEDVYPRRVGTMEEVKPHPYETKIEEDGKETTTEKWDAYRFKDSKLTFSKDYVLPGQELEIVFQSGALNGMRFAAWFNPYDEKKGETKQPEKNPDGTWNTKAQVFEIKRNEDYGRYLPDSIAFPRGKGLNPDGTTYEGDKYILSGFDPEFVLDTMIPDAEEELLEKAQEYVDKSKIDPSTYDCKMMPTYIHDDGRIKLFDIGDRVNLINKAYFDNGRQSRIIGFEYPLDIPYDSPIYTVGETAAYSRIGALEEKIDSLTYKGQTYTGSAGGGGNSVYVIGKNDKTTPSDSNVFSAVRTLAEILANNEEQKKLFLGKYGPDRTEHLLEMLGGIFVRGGIDTDSIKALTADIKKFTERTTFEKGATTLNLLVQALADIYDLNVTHVATMMRTIIKDYVSSETFIPGLTGEGMKIYKALNGNWNLEIDNVVVRKVMTIFELVVSKIRSVNGGLVISAANGRIKSVAETTGDPAYYVLGIEGDNQFVFDDLVRCQVFTSGQAKYYGVPVASVAADSILVLKSEFADGVVPVPGDDLIQMGNRTNTARQGLLYLTASEDGKPRFSVMDGVNSTSTVGKSKVILGCLDGMTDTDFPADFQPSGWGLYAMNVFLKGVFLLRNGKSVESEVGSAKSDAQTARDKANTVYDLFQAFTVAGGLFESKISEVKTHADGRVDGLQIGGRNLLRDSKQISITGIASAPYLLTESLRPGVQYILSGVVNATGFYVRVYPNRESGWDDGFSIPINTPFTVNSDMTVLHMYSNPGGVVFDAKLERGNKSTDWTPAPEDVAADAQTKANAAQAAAEAVALAQAALAKTEASAYADGIVTAEEQRAIADAQAKLNEAKQDAQNKAEAAKQAAINDAAQKYPTHSEVQSSIRQTKDEINLSVTEKISNVQIGGRNLILNSKHSNINNVWMYVSGLNDSEEVVIQMWGTGTVTTHADNGYGGAILLTTVNGYGIVKRIVQPHTFHPNNNGTVLLIVSCTGESKIKLERGNKATDWTPAPEDVQTQITANSAAIEVNSRGIALKASQEQVNGLCNRLTSAEGSLTVQAGQISAAVSSVDNLSGRMSSAELKLDPSQIWLGIKGNVSALVPTYSQIVDARNLDPNKYYLVTIGMSVVIPYTITVSRNLNYGWGVPPYSTHSGGFSVLCKWQCNGSGWGCITPQRTVLAFTHAHSTVCPVGSISQITESSEEYIYIRGGSMYEVQIDGTSSTPITLHTTTHTPRPDYPQTARPGVIDSVAAPVVDLDTKLTEEQVKAGIGITENGLTVFGEFIDFTGRVTFTSMSADAQNRITAAQNTANAANGAAGSAQNTANDAVNKANAAQGTANTGVANASAAQGTANDAWNRANNAQTSANNIDSALGSLRNSLGGLAYDNAVTLAKLDSTIIDGGYIKTNLINARAIVTGALIAEQIAATNITTGKLTVTNGAKIGDFYVNKGALSSTDQTSMPSGTSWFTMTKEKLSYNVYERVGYYNISNLVEITGKGIEMNNNEAATSIVAGKVTAWYPSGDALDVTGKIKVNGNYGYSGNYEIDAAWNNGWRKIGLSFTNGILTNVYWP